MKSFKKYISEDKSLERALASDAAKPKKKPTLPKAPWDKKNEAKDTHCSDKCCGSDVKAEDCTCASDCPHCNCNSEIDEGSCGTTNASYSADAKRAGVGRTGETARERAKRLGKSQRESVEETFDPKHPKVVAARKAHKAGTYNGNVDKNGNAIVHINGKPHTVTKGDPAAKNEGIGDNIKSALSFPKRKITGNHIDNAIKQHDNERKSHANAAAKANIIGNSGLTKKQKASYNDSKEMHHRAGEKHHTIAKNHLKAAQTANNKNKMDQAHKHMTDYHKHQDHKTFGKEVHVSKLRKMGTTNEAVDQLDELSPATLKSYKKKATKQYKQSANKRMPGGGDYGSATKAAQDKHQKRFDKRHKGIGSEIKRTTDSDIHLKDPKGLVRKNPKANSLSGKPAPYKYKAESFDLDEDTINNVTAAYINEHNISMAELEAMSPEQLDEIIGKAIGGAFKIGAKAAVGAGRLAKKAVVNKQGNARMSAAGRADSAEKKAAAQEKKNRDRERIKAAQDRLSKAKEAARNKPKPA